MKIVVGLPGTATPANLEALARAGADEFFVGYVPACWSDEFGYEVSPNRRYHHATQVTTQEQLRTLVAAAESLGCPVSLTFNEHFTTRTAWELGRRLIGEAEQAGVAAVIVADPALIAPLRETFPGLHVHVSGDAGIYNAAGCRLAQELGASRVIFPRELTLEDLVALAGGPLESEAFVMGEPCVFDGARCFTEHGYGFGCDFCNYHSRKVVVRRKAPPVANAETVLEPPEVALLDKPAVRAVWGLGKCGLCAIPALRRAGVTHVKVPGRASTALRAVALVRAMLAAPAADATTAQELLGVPALCRSRAFCYFPEAPDA